MRRPRVVPVLAIAAVALRRNKMRSLLTTLGVVIGVAAVIVMQGMGAGATAYVGETISGMGSNMLVVIPGTRQGHFGAMTLGVPLFQSEDIEAIRRGAPAVARITGANTRISSIVAGEHDHTAGVTGVAPEYFEIREWHVTAGRGLLPDDERTAATVCLVGKTVADALFPDGPAIGGEMRIRGVTCRVIGELESKGASFGQDQDDVVFMPSSTFSRRLIGRDRAAVLIVSAEHPDRIDEAKRQIEEILRRRRHIAPGELDNFAVQDPREIQAVLQTVTGTLTLLLAGIAAVSLLVGGIGIMNIMLVSVTERTREIGIRLAVGARSRDILRQFLAESIALSLVGGVIGVALGAAGVRAVASGLGIPFVLPWSSPAIAAGVSIVIGIAFGVWPARKAAHLDPIAALRFE